MNEAGHDRDWKHCRQKVKNLKTEFKKTKDNNDQSGRGRKICRYYEELEKIIGSRAAVSPPQLLESTGISVGSENEDDDDSIIDNINSQSDSQQLNEIHDKNDESLILRRIHHQLKSPSSIQASTDRSEQQNYSGETGNKKIKREKKMSTIQKQLGKKWKYLYSIKNNLKKTL